VARRIDEALREIAVSVARGAAPEAVFATISEQAAIVCGVSAAAVVRFADGGAVIAGRWGDVAAFPAGAAFALGAGGALTLVRNTGLPARFDEYERTGEELHGLREGAATPVIVEDEVWGALLLAAFGGERLPDDAEVKLTEFAQLASLALASADARERLLDSRERLVRAADAERKRLERNLHDGAQQRLVAARLTLRMLRTPELDPVIEEIGLALEELRELARGLHPAALSRGLGAAVGGLAARTPVPVEYDVLEERLPEAVEVAAYYVIAEAITNAVKYAEASVIRVTATLAGDRLALSVADDGRGGAVVGEGSGLVGLRDRVEALRGRLRVVSPPGTGTTVSAELPVTASSSTT
jgi:signal transduction histidine kinase